MRTRDLAIFFGAVCAWAACDGFTAGLLGRDHAPLWAIYILALLIVVLFAIREVKRG